MTKHHTEDYKLTAVKYYLDNNTSYKNVCDIFKCSERSLKNKIGYNAIHKNERPIYLSRSKVVSGATSVGKLQCRSSSVKRKEPAQPQFTQSRKG